MRKTWMVVAVTGIGTGLTFAALAESGRTPLRGYGLALFLVGALALATLYISRNGCDVTSAYEMGHAAGYREGRRVARPVVVPMRRYEVGEGSSDAYQASAFGQVAGDSEASRRDQEDAHSAAQG